MFILKGKSNRKDDLLTMKHLKILGIKFIVITVTVLSLFGIFNHAYFGNLLLIGLMTTLISYVVGDMLILRKFGNVAASVSDFILAFFSYWVLASFFIGQSEAIMVTSLAAAFFTACVEPFLHGYILNEFDNFKGERDYEAFGQLQTEFSKELDVPERDKQDYLKHKEDKD